MPKISAFGFFCYYSVMRILLRNTIETIFFNVLTSLLSLLLAIFVSRSLGPELKGIYSLVIFIPTMIYSFGFFGINLAANFLVAKKKLARAEVVSTSFALALIIGAVLFIIGYLAIVLAKPYYLPSVPNNSMLVAILITPVQIIFSLLDNLLLGVNRTQLFNKICLLRSFLNLILVGSAFFIGRDRLLLYVLAALLAQVIPLPLLYFWVKSHVAEFALERVKKRTTKLLFKFGLKNHLNHIILFLEYRIDILIINHLKSPLEVGFYTVAVAVAEASSILITPINNVIFPLIAGDHAGKNKRAYKSFSIYVSISISVILAFMIFLLSPWLITALFGSAFLSAVLPLKVLAFASIFANLRRILMSNLSAEDKAHISTLFNIPALTLNIALNFYLIPKFGITGAAVSSLATYAISALLLLTYSLKRP